MKIYIAILLIVLQAFSVQMVFAQVDRGAKNTKIEQKIALIIGNTNYDNSIGRLTNPVNDANDMAESLKRLGFTLVGGKPQMDVNRKQMLALIRDFGQQIKQGGIGFFYFSGHGVQVNKENYIIPITDALVYEDDAETEAVKVDMVAKEMELAGNRLNILVLDACRNNGLQKRTRNTDKGLTEPNRKPEGTFIAFSAGDGQTASDGTGKNGLFTQELLKNLETPNVRLDDIFRTTRTEVKRLSDSRQVPVLFDSTSEAFFLKSNGNVVAQTLPDSNSAIESSSSIDKTTIEREFWEAIKNSTNIEDFKLYKEKFPNGIYVEIADLKIRQFDRASNSTKNPQSNPENSKVTGQKPDSLVSSIQPSKNFLSGYTIEVWSTKERVAETQALVTRLQRFGASAKKTHTYKAYGDLTKRIEIRWTSKIPIGIANLLKEELKDLNVTEFTQFGETPGEKQHLTVILQGKAP